MSSMAALVVLGLSCSIPSHHGQQEGDMSQVPALPPPGRALHQSL